MTHDQRRIEDKLPSEPLKWPNADAELEGCDFDSYEMLYRHFREQVEQMGYPSISAALASLAPSPAKADPVAPQVPSGHWLPQRDPTDETMLLSKVTRQYPQLSELMGREALLMRCVREALCVEADPDVAHALQYSFASDALIGVEEPVGEFAGYADGIEPLVTWYKDRMPQVGDKLYTRAAPAEQASKQVPPSVLDLPSAIMNIPCRRADDTFLNEASRLLYKEGHRDARHDAADLVLERADELAALAGQPAAPVVAALTHVDTELATDVNAELLKRLEWAVRFIETYAHKAAMPATPEVNKCRAAIAKAKGGAA